MKSVVGKTGPVNLRTGDATDTITVESCHHTYMIEHLKLTVACLCMEKLRTWFKSGVEPGETECGCGLFFQQNK